MPLNKYNELNNLRKKILQIAIVDSSNGRIPSDVFFVKCKRVHFNVIVMKAHS